MIYRQKSSESGNNEIAMNGKHVHGVCFLSLAFSNYLRDHAQQLNAGKVRNELADLLEESELPGLDLKIRKTMIGIAHYLDAKQSAIPE